MKREGPRLVAALVATPLLLLLATTGCGESQSGDGVVGATVSEGRKVSIEYTLTLGDGTTADTNVGKEPLVYHQGAPGPLPALQAALVGLRVSDTKQVTLTPEEAFGEVQSEAFKEVPTGRLPEGARVTGAVMVAQDEQGNQAAVRVHEVGEETSVVDFNHPLAGKTLTYDVRVLAIE